jgi:hypothetical protein
LLVAVLAFCGLSVLAEDLKPGLKAEFFAIDGAVEDWPTIAADKKPTVTKIDKTVNVESTQEKFDGTELVSHFYARWTGVIKIEKDGKYKFFTNSDDGSRLFIDGKQVVDNGGLHGMEEKDGEVELKAGNHEIKVEFFENDGDHGCIASWEPAGGAKAVIPENVLFHKE